MVSLQMKNAQSGDSLNDEGDAGQGRHPKALNRLLKEKLAG
jgi:hypothetical protein